jgi:hypothetical protein
MGGDYYVMTDSTHSKRDVWIEAGVVWAAAEGALPDSAHQNLTQRAVAMAAGAGSESWLLLLDYPPRQPDRGCAGLEPPCRTVEPSRHA